jgi:hypothetical protein
MDLRELGRGNVDWIHLTQNKDQLLAPVNRKMEIFIKGGEFLLAVCLLASQEGFCSIELVS